MDSAPLPSACELAVVGAGPAGIAAATLAAELGVDAVLLDEGGSPGGAIYRDVKASSMLQRKLLGADFEDGMALVTALEASGVHVASQARVCATANVSGGFELCIATRGTARILRARRLILATGAIERPMPLRGRPLPGVMYAGGAQGLLKTTGRPPSGRVVLAGCGPLLYLVASQMLMAGADVVALLDTLNARHFVRALPHAATFMRSRYYKPGARLLREINDRVPIYHDVVELAALGNTRLASVRFTANKRTTTLIADALLLHQGIVPELHLADTLGCAIEWDETLAGWTARVDAWGASSVAGAYIAGDGASIAGAQAAAPRGRLAALAAARALGRIDIAARDAAAVAHREALAQALRGRRFLDRVYRAPDRFRMPEDEAVVCACENVTAGEVVAAVRHGAAGPHQIKAFLRCGMGACQGRDCGLTVTELIARERRERPQEIGRFRARFPARSITLAELASLPSTAAERFAVARIENDDRGA
jgi:thioredoxin reductase/bacterioferritin-associated ferredoxin